MARQGLKGSTLTLQVVFYENGSLFDPFDVDTNVGIYDMATGGTLVATLTAARVSLGVWEADWTIPDDQTVGTYYDEWGWTAINTMLPTSQRNNFVVSSNFVLSPTQNTLTLERRIQTLETAINTMAVAINNVPTKKQINSWQVLFQKMLNEIQQDLDTHKAVGH